MKIAMSAWCAALVVLLMAAPTAAQVNAERVLTALDVALITKEKGIHTVEKNLNTGASGDVNYADGQGELVLMMTVQPKAEFDLIKRTVAAPVAGVGDEAYQAPNAAAAGGMPPYMLVFRKGAYAVTLISSFTAKGTPRVPQAQLKQLAQIVAGKL